MIHIQDHTFDSQVNLQDGHPYKGKGVITHCWVIVPKQAAVESLEEFQDTRKLGIDICENCRSNVKQKMRNVLSAIGIQVRIEAE